VVVGNRGHGGFHDLLLGSTSLHTAMYAHCPVAVIRPSKLATADSEPSAGRIVVGVDESPRSHSALHFGFDHAERTGLGVTAVHAWQGAITTDPIAITYGPGTDEQQRLAEQELADAVAPWVRRYPQVDVRRMTVEMSPADALVRQSMGANLVVVGSRGLGGFAALVLGSAGHALIHHSGCPVVITHPSPAPSFNEKDDTP
jgi:nucleotide-binding universal stress UspA family protein